MKIHKNVIFFVLISALPAILNTCSPEIKKTGSLSLNLHYAKNNLNKTTLPDIDMSIDYYDITLQGPDNESIFIGNSNGTATVDNLVSGEWSVTATAVNPDNLQIGTGTKSVQILPRQIVSCELIVTPYEGFGGLQLTITWDGEIDNSTIEGTLDPAIGSVDPVEFTLNNGVSNYENTSLVAGYYIMTLKLFDNNTECGGAVDVIRIIADEITNASVHIHPSPANGGTEITIIPEINDPIEIALTGTVDTIQQGNSFSVTAEALNATDVIYSWFIDGSLKESGAAYNSYPTPADLLVGFHRLDVTMFTLDGLRGGSTSHVFEVIE